MRQSVLFAFLLCLVLPGCLAVAAGALILAGGVGILIGISNGYSWKEIQDGIVHGISVSLGAVLILLGRRP